MGLGLFETEELPEEDSDPAALADSAKKARAVKMRARVTLRRARSEAVLADILPTKLESGMSYHVISHGDVDSLSYLRHIVKQEVLTYVAISTLCMARNDVEELAQWIDSGSIDTVDWYVGEIFPNQYPAEMELVRELVKLYGGRLVVARNHSKVMLASNATTGYYVAIESSANVNTNPRIEQTAIHVSEALFDFYKTFYDGLTSIDQTKPSRIRQTA